MSEFIIYGVPGSPFMRSVCAALEEKGQPYRIEALPPSSIRGEEYSKLHPFGRIPVIEHGDYRLYETQAILRYIDALYPEPPLQPEEPQAIGLMNQVIGINDWYLFPQAARIVVFQRVVGPALMSITPDEAACAAAVPDLERCVRELNRLLDDQQFMAGDRLSIADLMLSPQLFYLSITPEGKAAMKDTALLAWLGRMEARPSMKATLPPEPLRKAAYGAGELPNISHRLQR
jgi:glutathione S-transferase